MVLSVTPELLYNPYLGVSETALGGFQHFNYSIAPTVELWIILLTLGMIFHILHTLPYVVARKPGTVRLIFVQSNTTVAALSPNRLPSTSYSAGATSAKNDDDTK